MSGHNMLEPFQAKQAGSWALDPDEKFQIDTFGSLRSTHVA